MSKAPEDENPIVKALKERNVGAEVTDVDHFRIHGGMAVDTDYIVTVSPLDNKDFDTFALSKTYSAFRTFAAQLKKATGSYKSRKGAQLPPEAVKITKYCDLVSNLIESQRTQYLGKVNYMYVKVLTKQRSQIINDVMDATCTYFPQEVTTHPLLQEVALMIETFFLTDHCDTSAMARSDKGSKQIFKSSSFDRESGHKRKNSNPLNWLGLNNDSKALSSERMPKSSPPRPLNTRKSVVVPMTRKDRRPRDLRDQEEQDLQKVEGAKLLLDDDRGSAELVPSYARPVPVVRSRTKIGTMIENNPVVFMVIAAVAMYIVYLASLHKVSMDGDVALLAIFAAFCLGLHTPRPMVGGFDEPPTMKGTLREDLSGRRLLRRSMAMSSPRHGSGGGVTFASTTASVAASIAAVDEAGLLEVEEEEGVTLGSPLPTFPPGAKIGSVCNCWSEPDPYTFHVRGPNYLSDKKKVPSEEFVFPVRAIDLFLTDTCPENVGRNSGVLGGKLRDVPTFIINFRLPWGVLLFYHEIPERFIPFLRACYEPDYDKSKLPPLDEMASGDRAVCRFLMNDMDSKNGTLKIVPVVVDGPWVVRQVVGGKPAIIGNKLPVTYIYQPAEGDKALYLEADLDIAASSAARYILSVTRSYTNVLTIDLGFVVQGNAEDELPEQMLTGVRIHGVDPLNAPSLPPMNDIFQLEITSSEDGSITPNPAS